MHYNNLDLMRLIFALFVIVSHSYPISGNPSGDLLSRLTGGQIMFSSIGVDGFFIISGFLIFNSLKYSKSTADYIWKRCLRIYPALFVVIVLTIIMGYFVSGMSFFEYFWGNVSARTYLINNLSLYSLQWSIAGVFDGNVLPGTINGSLWTLVYEFSLYFLIMLAGLGSILGRRFGQALAVATVFATAYLALNYKDALNVREFFWGLNFYQLCYLSSLFVFGSLLASLRFNEWSGLRWYCLGSAAVLVLAVILNIYTVVLHLVLPVFIISLGYSFINRASIQYSKIGDLSYGVYIYAFPIQQLLMHLFQLGTLELMIYSAGLALACGYMSWNLVESRAMKYKSVFADFHSKELARTSVPATESPARANSAQVST
nr:acyltransferase [Pseudomonas sp. 10B238]